jgi:predicted nuclease of predicted toxin-antitoxin system
MSELRSRSRATDTDCCVRLLFDHNLSPRLPRRLADVFADSSHVIQHGLDRAPDLAVWEFARDHGYILVTKDSDFTDLSLLRGFPPKVIWIRIGNCTTSAIEDLLRRHRNDIRAFDTDDEAGTLSVQP